MPLLGIAILVFSGCAGQKPPEAVTFYDSPEAALRALAASSPATQAITAVTRITVNHHGERYPLKAATMIQPPARLRLESIPVMGPPDFFLSITDGELRVFFPEKGAFYIGRATPLNISRFFPVSLPPADIISLLMGAPPENAGEIQTMQGSLEDGLYRIDQYAMGKMIRSLWLDPAGAQLVRFRRYSDQGDASLAVDFGDHVRIGNAFLPQKVTIREKETGTLIIRHSDVRPFAADPESFPLQIPEGVIPIPLDP
jgi:hypothetical protein